MPAAEPIRDNEDLKRMARYFLARKEYRNYCMIVLGVCSALRISDLLHLKWEDVWDSDRNKARRHIHITERKTGKRKTFALNPAAEEALGVWNLHKKRGGDTVYIFEGQQHTGKPISRVQAWRIIRRAAESLQIEGVISCHSLRKTFGYHAWADNDVAPALLMEIFNHSSFEVTKRYLGMQQDDLDETYMSMKLF